MARKSVETRQKAEAEAEDKGPIKAQNCPRKAYFSRLISIIMEAWN